MNIICSSQNTLFCVLILLCSTFNPQEMLGVSESTVSENNIMLNLARHQSAMVLSTNILKMWFKCSINKTIQVN